jgi:hypothetical protein
VDGGGGMASIVGRPARRVGKRRASRSDFSTTTTPDPYSDEFTGLALAREIRRRLRRELLSWASKTPLESRAWLGLHEIAEAYARIPGTLQRDSTRYDAAVEFLRRCIHEGRVTDAKNRSQVANLNESPLAAFRFDPQMAVDPKIVPGRDYFRDMVDHQDLWMRWKDSARLFRDYNIGWPAELSPTGRLPSPIQDRSAGLPELMGEALDEVIRHALRQVSCEAAQKGKLLNIKTQAIQTMNLLRRTIVVNPGLRARVDEIVREDEFRKYRGPVGVRLTHRSKRSHR